MAFTDPQTLATIASTTSGSTVFTLPRTGMVNGASVYTSADAMTTFKVSHQIAKRARRVVRMDIKAIVADPLLTGVNAEQSMAVYLVVDAPKQGFTISAQKGYVDNLCHWLANSGYANATRFLGGEI